jgi:hypothetical protein
MAQVNRRDSTSSDFHVADEVENIAIAMSHPTIVVRCLFVRTVASISATTDPVFVSATK